MSNFRYGLKESLLAAKFLPLVLLAVAANYGITGLLFYVDKESEFGFVIFGILLIKFAILMILDHEIETMRSVTRTFFNFLGVAALIDLVPFSILLAIGLNGLHLFVWSSAVLILIWSTVLFTLRINFLSIQGIGFISLMFVLSAYFAQDSALFSYVWGLKMIPIICVFLSVLYSFRSLRKETNLSSLNSKMFLDFKKSKLT